MPAGECTKILTLTKRRRHTLCCIITYAIRKWCRRMYTQASRQRDANDFEDRIEMCETSSTWTHAILVITTSHGMKQPASISPQSLILQPTEAAISLSYTPPSSPSSQLQGYFTISNDNSTGRERGPSYTYSFARSSQRALGRIGR